MARNKARDCANYVFLKFNDTLHSTIALNTMDKSVNVCYTAIYFMTVLFFLNMIGFNKP